MTAKMKCLDCGRHFNKDQMDEQSAGCPFCHGENCIQLSTMRKGDIGIHPALMGRYQSLKAPPVVPLPPIISPQKEPSKPPPRVVIAAPKFEEKCPDIEIPAYKLIRQIGKGAMGEVFLAKSQEESRYAAVKILSKEMALEPDLLARFERESAALRSFRHPNVVSIYDSGCHKGVHYFCMEYIHGTTLRRRMRKQPMSLEYALSLVKQILGGLRGMHARGIIHRDLKPENVLVEEKRHEAREERVVLVDFGLAGMLGAQKNPHPNLTQSRVTMGTVNYMAPEQHTDAKRVDHRSDLYSAGVILFEALTGDLPLGRFLLPSEKDSNIPREVDDVLAKALARLPQNRYQNADEFESALIKLESVIPKTIFQRAPVIDFQARKKDKERRKSDKKQGSYKSQVIYLSQYQSVKSDPGSQSVLSTVIHTWKRKPITFFGISALVCGLFVGVWTFKREAVEVVVTKHNATALFEEREFKSTTRSLSAFLELPSFLPEDGLVDMRSDSVVWEEGPNGFFYKASQGEAVHLRKALSFLVMEELYLGQQKINAGIRLKRPKMPLSKKQTTARARQVIDGPLPEGAGGVFYLNEAKSKAFGFIMKEGGSCGLLELEKRGTYFKQKNWTPGVCRKTRRDTSPNMALQCDFELGQCGAFFKHKKVLEYAFDPVMGERFEPAFGCQNSNCSFLKKG